MRVAWIGLGAMGAPMALSTIIRGHTLAGFARRPHEHEAIVKAGGTVTDVIADILADAEIVCVNLFSEAQIRDVLVQGGAFAAIPSGAILAIHSTVSPGFIKDLSSLRRDIDVLDAGFSGGPDEAARGELTLMVGGEAAVLDRARPLFSSYANYIAHAGGLGSGMALKVINNLMFGAHVAIARDGLRLVEESGLDMAVAVETLGRGSAASTALAILGRGSHPEATVAAIGRYLEKDVPIARLCLGNFDLGLLGSATDEFCPN